MRLASARQVERGPSEINIEKICLGALKLTIHYLPLLATYFRSLLRSDANMALLNQSDLVIGSRNKQET